MQADLQYGDMDIFNRMQEGSDTPVFSLANAVEPGTFNLAAMEETSTPALIMIMTLPHRMDALEVFDDMLDTARKLSEELNGRLCDDHRSVLTRQAIDDLRASLNTYTLNKSLSEQSAS
jgi:cell division protein ZipA